MNPYLPAAMSKVRVTLNTPGETSSSLKDTARRQPPIRSRRPVAAATAVVDHLDPLEGDQAQRLHAVQLGQKASDLLLGIDDFDHQGELGRKIEDLGGVDRGMQSIAHQSAQH